MNHPTRILTSLLVSTLLLSAQAQTDPAAELATLGEQVFSTGPNGEEATPASDIKLSEEELTQIRGMNATAAIVLHYGGNDWSNAQVDGLSDQFEAMGIEVIAVTPPTFSSPGSATTPSKRPSPKTTRISRSSPKRVSVAPTSPVKPNAWPRPCSRATLTSRAFGASGTSRPRGSSQRPGPMDATT